MTRLSCGLVIAVLAVLVCGSALGDYGSYVVICDETSSNVTFVNYPQYNCKGTPSLYTDVLNQCLRELEVFTWSGFCNSTNMWFVNYANQNCTGSGALSRWYVTYQCKNCINPECKNA